MGNVFGIAALVLALVLFFLAWVYGVIRLIRGGIDYFAERRSLNFRAEILAACAAAEARPAIEARQVNIRG